MDRLNNPCSTSGVAKFSLAVLGLTIPRLLIPQVFICESNEAFVDRNNMKFSEPSHKKCIRVAYMKIWGQWKL